MYRAKALGRSQCQAFDPSMHAQAIRRLTLETELRRALERGEFELHYQPIIELDTDEVCGFEALVRWVRPDGKVTYPAEFIKVAEETRLIIPLTDWVLREACARVCRMAAHLRPSADAHDQYLVEAVRSSQRSWTRSGMRLPRAGLLPGTLRLEITESFLLNSSDAVAQRLDDLRSIPVRAVPGRLRDRILVAELPPPVPSRRAEDRSVVHQPHRRRPQRRAHRRAASSTWRGSSVWA